MFSSFQVIESAYTHSSKRLRSQITQKAFMKVWKATGEAIDSEMRERNGVVVPGFGTFTYRANGQPCFILSNTFARQSRAQQAKPPVPGKSVSHKLNLSRVASIAGVEKHVAGDTIDCIARHCASLVNKTRGKDDLRISFHPVAELTFSKMKASIKFVTSFLSRLGKVPLTVGHLARHTARYSKGRGNGGTSVRSGATPRSNTSFAQNVANAAALAPSDVSSVVTDHYNDENAGHDIVDKIKKAIIRRAGSDGIQAVSRVLRLMDDSDDKRLSKSELKYGLRDFGIDLSSDQLNRVMQYFDRNNDGSISFDEFLRGLAPPMSDRRLSFVHQAFNILDNTGDGLVTIDDLANAYDVSWHPDVKEGTTEPVKVLRKFLDTFDSDEKDGIITIEEFEKYYENVSASIDDDEYFELMMRNAWHIDGGEGVAANTTNKRVLVTGNDGKQRVETVRNDLGMKRNSVSSARRRMREQGTKNVASVDLYGGFEKKNGARRDGSRGGGRRSSGGQNQSYEANTKSSANRYAESIDSNRPDGWCSGDNNDKEALPPNAPSTSSMKPPSDPETLAWNTLRRLLFTPPIPLIAMQQKLEMCVAIGTDQLLETSFQSKLSALHTKDQSKRKRNGDSPAPALSRSELRYISKMVAKLGGDSGYIDLSNLHKELVTFFGTRGSKPSNGQNFGSKSVIDRVRKKIVSSGGAGGIAALMRVLKVMDSSGDDALSRDELKAGLLDLGIDVSLSDMENLMIYFDRDHK
jgi:Ca2+-binding EF-hand superfamily protein